MEVYALSFDVTIIYCSDTLTRPAPRTGKSKQTAPTRARGTSFVIRNERLETAGNAPRFQDRRAIGSTNSSSADLVGSRSCELALE